MAESKKNDIVHSPLVTYASMISLLTLCPPFVILLINGFQGFVDLWPTPTLLTCEIIAAYGVFEVVLQLLLPGKTVYNPISPTGNCLVYKGEPLCVFYSRYGICKFGPSCKFDHPMGIFAYNVVVSSLADVPGKRLLGSSSGTAALSLSSEGLVESGTANPRRLSLS